MVLKVDDGSIREDASVGRIVDVDDGIFVATQKVASDGGVRKVMEIKKDVKGTMRVRWKRKRVLSGAGVR